MEKPISQSRQPPLDTVPLLSAGETESEMIQRFLQLVKEQDQIDTGEVVAAIRDLATAPVPSVILVLCHHRSGNGGGESNYAVARLERLSELGVLDAKYEKMAAIRVSAEWFSANRSNRDFLHEASPV